MNEAFKVAVDTVAEFLMHNDMLVYIVVYNKNALATGSKLFTDIAQYIDDNYVAEHSAYYSRQIDNLGESMPLHQTQFLSNEEKCYACNEDIAMSMSVPEDTADLSDIVIMLDESFSQMLLRKIDEKGMTDSECYKKANIDRKLFSKIRSNPDYKPSKPTVIAFCIALELSLAETNEMLLKAGFALSHSNKFDVIIEYFIKRGNYNIFEINEALFAFDQSLLGA